MNDTCATSPDGGIASINRFSSRSCILIAGGTDRKLDFKKWAKIVKRQLKPQNVILLAGSATNKMLKALGPKFQVDVFDTLGQCFKKSFFLIGKRAKSVILFSPAAKSFEKFKNEFNRGQQFNLLVKKLKK